MNKKENQSQVGNASLLQTARTQNYGVGMFGILSMNNKPQPKILDKKAKLSDITPLSGKKKFARNHLEMPYGKNIEADSGVLEMSMQQSGNSFEYSLSEVYNSPGTNGDYSKKKQNKIQSTGFSSLWPPSIGILNTQHQQTHNNFKTHKFEKMTKTAKKGSKITKKKTMDISRGLRFSAPAPMTLNRYQPQMGQEKTAPESKQYLEMVEEHEQQLVQAKRMTEAKIVVEDRFKQAFALCGLEEQFHDFGNENKNIIGNEKKKKLMKEILGKVRPNSSEKWQQNQEKSSAIQAAMAAAAAAVEAATGEPTSGYGGINGSISEKEARAIVSQALRRQKQTLLSTPGVPGALFHPSMMNIDRDNMITQEIDEFGRPVEFPVQEVMMKSGKDSVSELDASMRHVRNFPVLEIHTKNSNLFFEDDTVSSLGTPRVFEELDRLLLSEPHQIQQRPGIIRDFLENNMGGSAAPPHMVTSYDARALIDQLDSGTLFEDMTTGTARAENAVQFCNIASNCFHPGQKSLFLDSSSARDERIESQPSSYEEEEEDTFGDSETQEIVPKDEMWSMPTQAFTQAIDNAIRKAEMQIATNHGYYQKEEDMPLIPIKETRATTSPTKSSPGSELALNKSFSPSASRRKISVSPRSNTTSKIQNVAESEADKSHNQHSSPIDHKGQNIVNIMEETNLEQENNKTAMPRTRGGLRRSINSRFTKDQGRFLLEKDDAYWDTLSTIASTANDRSSESDIYMDEIVQPGPIPGEITTPSSEIKSVTSPGEARGFNPVIQNGINSDDPMKTNQRPKPDLKRSEAANLHQMMNDVTDLIDADLLDNLPTSKNKRYTDSTSLKMKKGLNHRRPSPESVTENMHEDNRNGSLAVTASQIAKGIRSVSWGFEEIYEDKNSHIDRSDHDTNKFDRPYNMTQKSQPCPEGVDRNFPRVSDSDDARSGEEDDLLSRTLELSKGLLGTIMGNQDVQNMKEGVINTTDDSPRHVDFKKNHPTPIECRDDFHHEEEVTHHVKTSESDFSPMIHSRLESLRNQRTRALKKFRQTQIKIPTTSQNEADAERDRDRLKCYSLSPSKPSSNYQQGAIKQSYSDPSDLELKYTTSESNASITPSQKARDLRTQLDEAMRASREIQISQNQLGNELNTFKKKYYKNPDIESYATKVVRSL